jgi:predicted transposase/invertase (TIGR01784 family)
VIKAKSDKMKRIKGKYINPLTDFGFKKLFGTAEIAKFSETERKEYEESLKNYRDIKNVVDTARIEGKMEGKIEGKIEGKKEEKNEIARKLKESGISIEVIIQSTGLSRKEIENL